MYARWSTATSARKSRYWTVRLTAPSRYSPSRSPISSRCAHSSGGSQGRSLSSSAWPTTSPGRPGVVVLDPHKLAKGKRDLEAAKAKYRDLNALGMADYADPTTYFSLVE